MRLQTLFITAWNFLISYQCSSRTLQTSRTSGTYYSQVCAPETCQHHLVWQDVERLVHLKELHQRNSCWECKNTGRKELLLSIYAFSGRWGSTAASCFFIIIHSPLSPLGQELCRNPVHPTRLWMHSPSASHVLSYDKVYRCLLTFKKLISIVLSFRRWPLQE